MSTCSWRGQWLWVLLWVAVCECTQQTVSVSEGQNVTLPCQYDCHYHGKLHICWMRGEIPSSGCGSKIISTDGDKVTWTKSLKYHLSADLLRGDVSLTILDVRSSDSGMYGCRVHIPGLFNDEKRSFTLEVTAALSPSTQDSVRSSSVPDHVTAAPGNSSTTADYNPCNSSCSPSPSTLLHEEDAQTSFSQHSAVLMPVALLLALLVSGLVFLIRRRQKKSRTGNEMRWGSTHSAVYSNSGSSLGLYSRDTAVENIYQLDTSPEYEEFHP